MRTLIFILIVLLIIPSAIAQPAEYIINSNADTDDGVCDVTHCTLREAINAANANPGEDTIFYDEVDDPEMIYLLTPLPTITEPVIIDATYPPAYNSLIVNGSQMIAPTPEEHIGLNIIGGGTTLRRAFMTGFQYAGIRLADGGDNFIIDSRSGPSLVSPIFGDPNGIGILIENSANNRIENTDLMSNLGDGLIIRGSSSTGNVIFNNRIGVELDYGTGVEYEDEHNGGNGIRIENASRNEIRENHIAFNDGYGVIVSGSAAIRNRLQMNYIFDNGLGDIELDSGGNANQTSPVLTTAWVDEVNPAFMVEGTLNGYPNVTYRVEFFTIGECDAPVGENTYGIIGVFYGKADWAGILAFQHLMPSSTPGSSIIATATDSVGNTSTFSNCIMDTGMGAPLTAAPRINVYSSTPIMLTWSEVTGAVQYQIQLSYQSEFEFYKVVDEIVINPYFQFTDGGNYFWRVRALDINGYPGLWSEVQQFVLAIP